MGADADDGSVQVPEAVLGDVGGDLCAEAAEPPGRRTTSDTTADASKT